MPRRVLEVGCGRGEFAERLAGAGIGVVAVDQSARMVELTRARGVDARLGDVQALPFADGEFDAAVANFVLYHVRDIHRALAELARVLRPGGTLVAATNGVRQLAELWELVGRDLSERRRQGRSCCARTSPAFARSASTERSSSRARRCGTTSRTRSGIGTSRRRCRISAAR